MRDRAAGFLLVVVFGLVGTARAADDERAAKVAAQKTAAVAVWEALEAGDRASAETKHLLLYAPKAMEKRLKTIGTLLEKYHDLATGALGQKPEEAYPGKITVYLLAQREQIPTFARRIEKRRPRSGETGSFNASDAKLHVAAAPVEGKTAPPVEALAGEQLAALLLMRRVGERTSMPDWLVHGFGRATSYRAWPAKEKFVLEDRKLAKAFARRRTASDVWSGTLEGEEADCLQGSLCNVLAYATNQKRFQMFVDGFKPGDNVLNKTTEQAMSAAGMSADKVNKVWKASLR